MFAYSTEGSLWACWFEVAVYPPFLSLTPSWDFALLSFVKFRHAVAEILASNLLTKLVEAIQIIVFILQNRCISNP